MSCGDDLYLTVLPYELRMASLSRNNKAVDGEERSALDEETFRAVYSHSLTKCLFYDSTSATMSKDDDQNDDHGSSSGGRMFSITSTPDEISILADENTLKRFFPQKLLVTSQRPWVPLQVIAGASGHCDSNLLHELSTPLASAGIAICYLSTIQNDYVLVDKRQLKIVVELLRQRFVVEIEGLPQEDLNGTVSKEELDSLLGTPAKKHSIAEDKKMVCTREFKKEMVPSLAYALLQVGVIRNTPDAFFSYTEVGDEISLMIDEEGMELLARCSNGVIQSGEEYWKALRVADGPLGFDECGIVAGISASLSKSQTQLPLMYLSTFETDRVLVLEEDLPRALELLSSTHTIIK